MNNTDQTASRVVGANIKAELARRGLSQRALAGELGIAVTGVSKRLSGLTPINVDELHTIAGFLGVDPMDQLKDAA